MRKIGYLILLIMSIPAIAYAHTELTSSNPTADQVVKAELQKIVLTFGGKIESLSSMEIEKEGQKIPLSKITPKGKQMFGTLPKPLEDGSYTINWSIVGKDGHSITGQVPFSVQIEGKSKTDVPKSVEKAEQKQRLSEDTEIKSSSSIFTNIFTAIIVLILLIGLIVLFRKKK